GFARIGRGSMRSGFGVRERKQPMRYCGNCGATFDPALLVGRTCPSCGMPINQTGDITFPNAMDVTGEPTRQPQADADALSLSSHPTLPEHGYTDTRTHIEPPRRISRKLPIMLALIGLALLLVGGSEILLSDATGGKVHLPGLPAGVIGGPEATATLSASLATSATSTAGAQPGPLALPTGSPFAETPGAGTPITGTVTPDATMTATVTPVPGQPTLAVTPSSIGLFLCLGASTTFTVTNSGEGGADWSATASQQGYKISPQGGSLYSGQKQTVTVSSISASGRVTITAPGATNSPQTVSINCTL
ncbi:MAG TPA: hypothetical protein VFS83_02230, partial [Ktedonobacterales bacterium]|nr:hypothetical protein [Ktedonobacterales bacterium]